MSLFVSSLVTPLPFKKRYTKHQLFSKQYLSNGKIERLHKGNETYVGRICDSEKEGYGVSICKNGDIYIGRWKAGLPKGDGIKIDSEGNLYVGRFGETSQDDYLIQIQPDDFFVQEASCLLYDHKCSQNVLNMSIANSVCHWNEEELLQQSLVARLRKQLKGLGLFSDLYANVLAEELVKKVKKGALVDYVSVTRDLDICVKVGLETFHIDRVDYVLPNMRLYCGEVLNGKPHGFGIADFVNKDYYEGHFVAGLMQGDGYLLKKNGTFYQGQLKNNVYHGFGTLKHISNTNGHVYYNGDWVNGKRDGKGTQSYNANCIYIGNWKQNKHHGEGVLIDLEDGCYVGSWRENKKHGRGVDISAFGSSEFNQCRSTFDGMWVNGKREGQAVCNDFDGNMFRGSYVNDLRHGTGIETFVDGGCFKGTWKNGLRQGKGTYVLNEHHMFHANWNQGKPFGRGKLVKFNLVYDGVWKESPKKGTWELRQQGNLHPISFSDYDLGVVREFEEQFYLSIHNF